MSTETLTRITEQADPSETAESNLAYLQYVFEGYRDTAIDNDAKSPYEYFTEQAVAWEAGRDMAVADLRLRP
jgi:hypothetical protein